MFGKKQSYCTLQVAVNLIVDFQQVGKNRDNIFNGCRVKVEVYFDFCFVIKRWFDLRSNHRINRFLLI
ncbi:MAG: hypothetical protein J6C40_03815 [Lentisphaeria bacterium]|nr:hypothetical protein [Lentisphaeria bacterium]